MYLLGDIGNTETKFFKLDKNLSILNKFRLKTKKINTPIIKKKLTLIFKSKIRIKKVLISSVVPSVYQKIRFIIKKNFQTKSIELKSLNLKKFIEIKVNKRQVGSDRLANAIAIKNNKKNFVIIDFGTATTFDVISGNNYLGGIIAPGIELSLKSLSMNASLIPKIKFKKIKNVLGKNTKSAVRSGFYFGYLGLINNIVKLIQAETKKNFQIVLTGGLSHLFKNSFKKKNNCK